MTISIHGIGVGRGVGIGRAVVIASSRADVGHYFIDAEQVEAEIARVYEARDALVQEIQLLLATMNKDMPGEVAALLEVHMLLLQDDELYSGVRYWIADRLYNAGWALSTQFERLARQFEEMDDPYLRERKADLEQVIERLIKRIQGEESPLAMQAPTCCNSARVCSRALLLMSVARPRTRRSWRAAWAFRRWWARVAPAGWCSRTTGSSSTAMPA